MKGITSLSILTSIIFTLGCATKPRGAMIDTSSIYVEPGKALVLIYRQDQFTGSAISWVLAEAGTPLAVISVSTYYAYSVSPGDLVFTADKIKSPLYLPTDIASTVGALITATEASHTNADKQFDDLHSVTVEAGKLYYFRWETQLIGPYKTKAYLVEVDEQTGLREIEGRLLAGPPEGY